MRSSWVRNGIVLSAILITALMIAPAGLVASGRGSTSAGGSASDAGATVRAADFDSSNNSSAVIIPVADSGSPVKTTYRIYDMFQEPWHPWWNYRYKVYGTDIILTNTPGNYTMLYNPDRSGYQGIIYAPYRMNITASNQTNVNVQTPEFMPVLDSSRTFAGANATVDIYFQYLSWDWWNNTWVPKWHSQPNWFAGSMNGQTSDGWYLGVQYNVTMNREAAQEWLRLPVTAVDVAAWWQANASSYKSQWASWLLNEGNNRLDIYNAYEFPMVMTGPYAKLTQLPNGDVRLELDHVSWGYEVLMNRWLTEKGICSHQPYLEDFKMSAKLGALDSSLTMDTVCQYNLHAVKANQSSIEDAGAAWAFEPIREDYLPPSINHPHSDYEPYLGLTYTSWNAGDPWFGTENQYEATPGWFNLTASQKLVFQLPRHDEVICYEGRAVPPSAIINITYGGYPNGGDFGEYTKLMHHGSMSLGYSVTNLGSGIPLDLNSMYDTFNKTLTINGPHNFDNSGRGEGKPLYHGAPWIEFDVIYGLPNNNSNTPPVASFTASPQSGVTGTNFTFDASACSDAQDPASSLVVRWDWEGDGTWDTYWSSVKVAHHSYLIPGNYDVRVEVMDSGRLVSSTDRMVTVLNPPIPTLPGAVINVSYATSVTVFEQTTWIDSYTFDLNTLVDSGGVFYTFAQIMERYTVHSNGVYLTIDCYRDPPTYLPAYGPGGNIVAVRLNGVPGYPDGLWASMVVSYEINVNGTAASVYNALGPDTQVGPYNNGYATLLGDYGTMIELGFTVPTPPPINATVDFDLKSLNPSSNGNWVKVYIGLPSGYNVRDIDVSTVMLNGKVPATSAWEIKDFNHDKSLELLVKFDRKAASLAMNGTGDVTVTVSGSLTNGTSFAGSDIVTIHSKTSSVLGLGTGGMGVVLMLFASMLGIAPTRVGRFTHPRIRGSRS